MDNSVHLQVACLCSTPQYTSDSTCVHTAVLEGLCTLLYRSDIPLCRPTALLSPFSATASPNHRANNTLLVTIQNGSCLGHQDIMVLLSTRPTNGNKFNLQMHSLICSQVLFHGLSCFPDFPFCCREACFQNEERAIKSYCFSTGLCHVPCEQ